MQRMLFMLLLFFAWPASASLLDAPPTTAVQNPADATAIPATGNALASTEAKFLPAHAAFQLSVLDPSAPKITVRFIAAEGYYLYRQRFEFQADPPTLQLGAAQLPAGEAKHDESFGDVEVYHHGVEAVIARPANSSQAFKLRVTYQGCADRGLCYPKETVVVPIEAVAGAPAALTQPENIASQVEKNSPVVEIKRWDWQQLLAFFAFGLALTFTPCVLPMLPILSGVVLSGRVGGWRGLRLSLAYVIPMALCFAGLGALMGQFGATLNLQARLQSPWVLVPFALLFGAFALAMFGIFELRLPSFIHNRLHAAAGRTQGGSLLGAALLGVLSSLIVSPCISAPLAGLLLYISSSGDALGGAVYLFALGLGMGAPLLLVATGGAAWLPKSGPWLLTVKNVIGVLLLGTALGLLSRVMPGQLTLLAIGVLSAGIALFLGTLEFSAKTPKERLRQLAGILLLAYGLACWYGAFSGHTDPFQPLAGTSNQAQRVDLQSTGSWQTVTSPNALDQALLSAKTAGQPVLLDWSADWCISCKVIDRDVLQQPNVAAQLAGYRLIRFDITESNEEQRNLLQRLGLFGPPALMFFDNLGNELTGARIIGEVGQNAFLDHLQQLKNRQ